MKKIDLLKKSALFQGINEKDIITVLNCLKAEEISYRKNEKVVKKLSDINFLGIVLSGCIHIEKFDYWGNRSILASISEGEIFLESFCFLTNVSLPIEVIATKDSTVLMVNCNKIITNCSSSCKFHSKLVLNTIKILSKKNVAFLTKLNLLSERNIRDKVISYLSSQAIIQKNNCFNIPFNRQELADYLLIDRCSLSKELCKLKKEGKLDFRKNNFKLHI